MGGIFTKKEQKQLKSEETVLVSSFYVETKLDDVPNWAELEWQNLLRQREVSMDQGNLDRATQKLRDGEKILQDNQELFEELRATEEKHMIDGRRILESEQIIMKSKSDNIQIREDKLKYLESEEILIEAISEKIQIREEKLKAQEEFSSNSFVNLFSMRH